MALCTACGAIMQDDDMLKHKCDKLNIPEKGYIKQPETVEIAADGY